MDERGQIQELFEACVDLSTSERERYLLEHCPSDALRARVHRMLNLHDDTDGEFGIPASDKFRELLNAPGESIGDFEIIREAGRGGMSLVYLARDTVLDREVALKVLGADRSLSETSKQRFLHEARAAAGLNHPNIIKIFRYGETDQHGFIAMEYIPNGTFDRWLAERDKETNEGRREIVRAIESIAEALESAHRAGVIHRDVKPTNILMDGQGRPYLADFGIARVTESIDARETLAGAGTAAYMSPEQIAAVREEIDHRSDIFSLGVVLYEALVGQLPFKGRNGEEIKDSIRKTEPAKPRSIIRSLPRDLEVICGKAMEKNPNDRYPSAGHMAADLRAWVDGKPILARPPSIAQNMKNNLPSRRSALIAIGAITVGGSLGAYTMFRTSDDRPLVDASRVDGALWVRELDQRTGLPKLKNPSNKAGKKFRTQPGFYRFLFRNQQAEYSERTRYLTPGDTIVFDPIIWNQSTRFRGMAKIQIDLNELSICEDENYISRVKHLDPYWIDETEVTCSSYKEYIQETGREPPALWGGISHPTGWDLLPVTGITWMQAVQYAEWKGKRLPSRPEWEYAARGPKGNQFPWGNQIPRNNEQITDFSKHANISQETRIASSRFANMSGWMPVDLKRHRLTKYQEFITTYLRDVNAPMQDHVGLGTSRLTHMLGNTLEWTESMGYVRSDQEPNSHLRIAMSDSWARSIPEDGYHLRRIFPIPISNKMIGVGFRCAISTHTNPSTRENP